MNSYENNEQLTRYVQAGDIGDMFDVSSTVVLKWAKSGKIPSIKLPSGRYCFDPDDVTTALRCGNVQGG